jgi:hypothetical protein
MMTTSRVAARRAEWRQRAYRRRCMHVVLEMECNEQGIVTDHYVCNFCGEVVVEAGSELVEGIPALLVGGIEN